MVYDQFIYTFVNLMKIINLNHNILSVALVLFCTLAQSCNDEVFVDRNGMTVSVSERVLQPTGGRSLLQYGASYQSSDYPCVSVNLIGESSYEEVFQPNKVVDKIELTDGCFFSLTAEYNPKTNEVVLNLDKSLYTDSVCITIERPSGISYAMEYVKVAPAPNSVVSEVSYALDYYTEADRSYQRRTYNYVNSSDSPKTFAAGIAQIAQFKPFDGDRLNSSHIFGDSEIVVPAVVWDGSKMVEIDDTVPFSTTMGSIFTKELSYYEKIEYDVPPRCLFQVVADITYVCYSMWFTVYVTNPAFADFKGLVQGEYLLFVPAEIRCTTKAFDLDTEEEIPT